LRCNAVAVVGIAAQLTASGEALVIQQADVKLSVEVVGGVAFDDLRPLVTQSRAGDLKSILMTWAVMLRSIECDSLVAASAI
jgi:hypothetical protein